MTPRFVRPERLAVARARDGSLFVMPLPDGPPRALNGSAEVIWEIAEAGSERLVQDVAEAFDVDVDAIAGDVEDTLRSFVELGILEEASQR